MSVTLLILFLLTSFFNQANWDMKNYQPQSITPNELSASVFDLSSFKLAVMTKKLPEEVAEKITATNFLIKEINGGTIYERNSSEVKPIASLTKLMTSVVAYQIYPETEQFTISATALESEGWSGGFVVDEMFKRNDLIKSALAASSNDAAYALAEKIGLDQFVSDMNFKAKELGMNNSQFSEPTGIKSTNKASLLDLGILVEYMYRNNPELLNFSVIESFSLSGKHKRAVENLNYLLPYYKYYIIGSKTGFTADAGECLILVLKFEKSPAIFIGLLNSKNRLQDAEKLIKALKKLYE